MLNAVHICKRKKNFVNDDKNKEDTMKTKQIIIISAMAFILATTPCLAINLNKNINSNINNALAMQMQMSAKPAVAYPYTFLPVAPVWSAINLSWQVDTAKMAPNQTYQNAQTFSVMLYGLADYSYGTSEPYTQENGVLVCLEYTTTQTSISLDLSMVQADALNYIANMEGISISEIQNFTFTINAQVKGICSNTTSTRQKLIQNISNAINGTSLNVNAAAQTPTAKAVTTQTLNANVGTTQMPSTDHTTAGYSDPILVYILGWSLIQLPC